SSYNDYYRGNGNPGSKRDVQDPSDNEKREPGKPKPSIYYRPYVSERDVQDPSDNEKREPRKTNPTIYYRPYVSERDVQDPSDTEKREPRKSSSAPNPTLNVVPKQIKLHELQE
ncbi:4105_t:CDS:1, partial [Racocetra persica]